GTAPDRFRPTVLSRTSEGNRAGGGRRLGGDGSDTVPVHHSLSPGKVPDAHRGPAPRRRPGRTRRIPPARPARLRRAVHRLPGHRCRGDRKSTRLNSSHVKISYAVFCLKKKTNNI